MSLISLNETEPAAVAVVAETGDMSSRVAWCNDLHGQVNAALERAWQTAVVLGYELQQLKASLPHGEFGKLFENNSKSDTCVRFAFTDRHARRYMTLFDKCIARANELGVSSLEAFIDEFSATRAPEDAERLTGMFNEIAPEATSMRQALFEFMKQEPEFTKRNELGQIKRAADSSVLRVQVSQELCRRAQQLGELIESGRYTLADGESRHLLADTCNDLVRKLRAVK